jgi:octaprenyl-diphosphate synthase
MTIERLRMLVREDFDAVNRLIVEKIQSEVRLIDDLSHHILESGGKRLRPLLVLLSSRACGYQGQDHIALATMIEFFHTATLLHDDVIDESTLRRGRETAHEIWGSKASILVGDYLFTQYMQFMVEIGDLNIMRLLTKISHEIGCGELKQLANRHNTALSTDDYFDVIRSKTSLLFAASATLGALISKAEKPMEDSLYAYGLHLGNAFQLIDDALDYCSNAETMGKNIGDDLADGKATLPLIHALQHGTAEQREQIKMSLSEGTLKHLPAVLNALAETRAIEQTYEVAKGEVDKALTALHALPASLYKEALVDLARYAVERDH